MTGYYLFLDKLNTFDLEERKEIIRKIFNFKIVHLYTVNLEEDNIVFRIYDGYKYYRLVLDLEKTKKNVCFSILVKDICVNCEIYVYSVDDRSDLFSNFLKIIRDCDISYFDSFL